MENSVRNRTLKGAEKIGNLLTFIIIGRCLPIVIPFKLLQTYEVGIIIHNLQVTEFQVRGGAKIQTQVSLLPKSTNFSPQGKRK